MGRDVLVLAILQLLRYFNPLSPHGERRGPVGGGLGGCGFQSTLPAWGETIPAETVGEAAKIFQSTLPAWGETGVCACSYQRCKISIHSPRMGRDAAPGARGTTGSANFNPLSPHGERLGAGVSNVITFMHFNPLSPHGERLYKTGTSPNPYDFNPLSPHGERPELAIYFDLPPNFNPLSPHGERQRTFPAMVNRDSFQSTLPAWGETQNTQIICKLFSFQSTLPAWGETSAPVPVNLIMLDFNPLSPHGERLHGAYKLHIHPIFQSTLPAWGETGRCGLLALGGQISIHSPRMGRDHAVTHTPH